MPVTTAIKLCGSLKPNTRISGYVQEKNVLTTGDDRDSFCQVQRVISVRIVGKGWRGSTPSSFYNPLSLADMTGYQSYPTQLGSESTQSVMRHDRCKFHVAKAPLSLHLNYSFCQSYLQITSQPVSTVHCPVP